MDQPLTRSHDAHLRLLLPLVLILLYACTASAEMAAVQGKLDAAARRADEWFKSDEGRQFCEHIVSWQNPNGGWWKKYDLSIDRPTTLPAPQPDAPPGDTEDVWRHTSTIDNGATYTEMRILAHAFRVTGRDSYKDAFNRGLGFLFASQYPNGGWPQRFPLEDNYGRCITLNDDAMINVMFLLRDVAAGKGDFSFVADADRTRASFDRGLRLLLDVQIKAPDGTLTGWAQQYDPQTLAPAKARSYELPAISGSESADVVMLLMQLEKPDDRVRTSVEAAVAWFERSKIVGKRLERVVDPSLKYGVDRRLVDDPSAPPLWARFYEIETNRPFFCDRDGVKRYSIDQIGEERRNHYAWLGTWGERVLAEYPKWTQRVGAAHADAAEVQHFLAPAGSGSATTQASSSTSEKTITVAADGSGDFKSLQAAVDSLPANSHERAVIRIKPGSYKEHVTIDRTRPPITLRGTGDDPKATVLTNDWNASYTPPAATRPVGTSGSATVTVDAAELTAENLTFENTAGETGQALALKTTGDRGVYRHCRFLGWQDTLCPDGGRQYFVDCYIEGRVDFIFGGATAVFDRCTIHSKNGGHVTAARTLPEQRFGYVFLDCTLTGEGAPADLGRPWQWDRGRRAAVAFIRCKMGPHIKPEGWNKWDLANKPNTEPEKTTRYSEFATMDLDGKPLDVSKRVPWSHQLTEQAAADYTVTNILRGDDNWDPTTSGASN